MKSNNLLYIQVKEKLLEEIKNLKQNERIPSRTNLVKKYGVTRTTIDRAISELIGEGYLYSRDGSGTYVSENDNQNYKTNDGQVTTWGVILPNIMHDTYPGILRGVEDIANENEINTLICNTDNNLEKQTNYILKQIETGVKGLIIVPAISDENNSAPFKLLKDKNIPFIFCNRGVPGIDAPKVISNNFYGGYIVTKHMLESGYKNIAYISKPMYSVSSERYQGYTSALLECGFEIEDDMVIFEESFDIEDPGYESAKTLLTSKNPPDAIFCFNDTLAKGAYRAIEELGLRVGRDVGLAGYDDTSICRDLPVKLTSVKFKTYETGVKAAEILLKIMKDENILKNKTIVLQPELVIRESSGKN